MGGLRFCSSILPWRACGNAAPWGEGTHAEKTQAALGILTASPPANGLVWGGDWNHALSGPETAGSKRGRQALLSTLHRLGLITPTDTLPHRLDGIASIDHIAVPRSTTVTSTERFVAETAGRRLSDHDAYVLTAELAA